MFSCLYCALGGVAAMHVRRDKLESYSVFFESFAEFFTTFIVKDVKFRGVSIGLDLDNFFSQLAMISAAWRVLIGFERIKFESYSYIIMMY